MVRACVVVTLDLDLAAAAVAAAWPVAWDQLGELEDPARLRAWLCGIAAREARDVVLYGSSRLRLGPQDIDSSQRSRPGVAATDPELAIALDLMPVSDRVFLALRDAAGLTPTEVGQAVGVAPEAAAAHTRGLARSTAAQLDLGVADRAAAGEDLARRIRALSGVSVGHVDVDAVARVAKITRHDRRNQLVSLAVAGLLALVITALPYLGESGPWPALAAGMSAPWPTPSPSIEPLPRETPEPH